MGNPLTVWSIRLAVCCLFGFLIARLRRSNPGSPGGDSCTGKSDAEKSKPGNPGKPASNDYPVSARGLFWIWPWIWGIGSILSLLHLLFAMGFVHEWSHERALEDTAQQTDELLGIRVGFGVYFNYLFVSLWLADAFWLLVFPASYFARTPKWNRWIYGYLIFIAINGAIVFESGLIRWVSLVLLVMLLIQWRQSRLNETALS